MAFSDRTLSKRLERAEGFACIEFADARWRLFPESGSIWAEIAGALAAFDGIDSPITQSFGLGLCERLTPEALDLIEEFFFSRGAPANHEISPFIGTEAIGLLCDRGYRPIEISSVLYRPVEMPAKFEANGISVRVTTANEANLWAETSTRGWSHEHPELREFMSELGTIAAARSQSVCFLAEYEGKPGAAGAISIHEGIALFAGSATVPELRRRGLQSALLEARMRYAVEAGCDIAMMVAELGSNSQRNAERKGFQTAYTRTKWQRLPC